MDAWFLYTHPGWTWTDLQVIPEKTLGFLSIIERSAIRHRS